MTEFVLNISNRIRPKYDWICHNYNRVNPLILFTLEQNVFVVNHPAFVSDLRNLSLHKKIPTADIPLSQNGDGILTVEEYLSLYHSHGMDVGR